MKKILLNTLCSNLIAVCGLGLTVLIARSNSIPSPLFLILVGFNSIIPTFFAVLLYYFLIRKISLKNPKKTFVLRILSSIFLYSALLLLWSIGDVITGEGFTGLSVSAVARDYRYQFSGYNIIAVMLGILIPFFDILLTSISNRLRNENKSSGSLD